MTEKRTHRPEVNTKLQKDYRDRKHNLGLVRVESWILPEDKAEAKEFEKKSQEKAKNRS